MEEEINLLEKKITELKTSYYLFFLRVQKVEPIKLRNEILDQIRKLSNRSLASTALSFKFNTLASKFGTYCQYWDRMLKRLEEEGGKGIIMPPPILEDRGEKKEEKDFMKMLYEGYIQARKRCNQSIEGLSFDKFSKTIEKQIPITDISHENLRVVIQEGKVKIIKVRGEG